MVMHAQRPPGVLVGSSCPYNRAPESHTIRRSYQHKGLCWRCLALFSESRWLEVCAGSRWPSSVRADKSCSLGSNTLRMVLNCFPLRSQRESSREPQHPQGEGQTGGVGSAHPYGMASGCCTAQKKKKKKLASKCH